MTKKITPEMVAIAMGEDFSVLHRDKKHWTETGGWRINHGFVDVNGPFQCDYEHAAWFLNKLLGISDD